MNLTVTLPLKEADAVIAALDRQLNLVSGFQEQYPEHVRNLKNARYRLLKALDRRGAELEANIRRGKQHKGAKTP